MGNFTVSKHHPLPIPPPPNFDRGGPLTAKSSTSTLGDSSRIFLAQTDKQKRLPSDTKNSRPPLVKNHLSLTTKKIAQNLFKEALRYYVYGKFEEALDNFQKIYRLTQNSEVLYNIAQCHRQLGRMSEALQYYREYNKAKPKAPVADIIKKLEKWEKLSAAFPREADKLFADFQGLVTLFPEEPEKYWPDFLSDPKHSETGECGVVVEREKLILAIFEQMTILLQDEDPAVVWAASVMMDKIGLALSLCLKAGKEAQAALPALESLIHHPRPEVRSQAAQTLEKIIYWVRRSSPHNPETLFLPPPPLLQLLNDPASQVRVAAVLALSHFHSGAALLELYKRETSAEVKGALAEAFGSATVYGRSDVPTALDTSLTQALTELAKENDLIAEKAVFSLGLGLWKNPNRAWQLIKALDHVEPLIRLRAVTGLMNGAHRLTAAMRLEAIPKLKKLTGNKLEGIYAAVALAKMGEAKYALMVLNNLAMNSDDPNIRERVASSLEFIATSPHYSKGQPNWYVSTSPVVSILNKLLQDKEPSVQMRAKRALAEIEKERKRWGK